MIKKKLYERPRIEVVKIEATKMLCGSIVGNRDYDAMP